jgi:hypothetical protein
MGWVGCWKRLIIYSTNKKFTGLVTQLYSWLEQNNLSDMKKGVFKQTMSLQHWIFSPLKADLLLNFYLYYTNFVFKFKHFKSCFQRKTTLNWGNSKLLIFGNFKFPRRLKVLFAICCKLESTIFVLSVK